VDLDEVAEKAGARARLIVVTDLHNPSGRTLGDAALLALGEVAARSGALVVVDEVYRDALGPRARPAVALGDRFVSVGSLCKVMGLGPLRVGWALGPPAVIARARLAFLHDAVCLAGPSVEVALAALARREALIARSSAGLAAGARAVAAWAAGRRDVRFHPPDAGRFGWLELPPGLTGRALADRLIAAHDTVVGPGDFFGDPGGVRLSFGAAPADLAEGLARLGKGLDSLG
jgi:aspartate/methionine/tyrosine aminotransferase